MAGKKQGPKPERYDTLKTPQGIAGFSFLRDPDEKFSAKHRIQLFIDPKDPEVKVFVQKIMAAKATYLAKVGKPDDGKVPSLKKADAYLAERFKDQGVKEGALYFEFTSNARKVQVPNPLAAGTTMDGADWQAVDIYDVKNVQNNDLRVFGGDIIRVAVTLMSYQAGKEFGVKPYLNAVQVLVKKSGSGGRVNPFADESASFAEAPTEEPVADATLFADESAAGESVAGAPSATKAAPKTVAASPAPKVEVKAASPVADAGEGGVSLADLV